jgi:scyllo-inositol 2-dehydrogenase (NADP+)
VSAIAPVQVGIVGFGVAARIFHAPLVQAAGMNICGVVSSRPDTVAVLLPGALAVPTLESLLAMPELQVVIIATPNDQHEAQAIAALSAGKCVVVEKPIALDLAAADRLLAASALSRGSLTAFHNRRWDSDFLTVQKLIATRTLGTLQSYEARWNRYRPDVVDRWRERAANGGGTLLDLGPHLIDQALVLFGKPLWIEADVQCRRVGATVDDHFEIKLGYEACNVVLGSDYLTEDPGPRFTLKAEGGRFSKYGLDVQETQLRAGQSPLDAEFGIEPAAQDGSIIGDLPDRPQRVPSERGRWLDFYTAVRSHLERGTALPVAAGEAREVLRIIDAARRSAATRKRLKL